MPPLSEAVNMFLQAMGIGKLARSVFHSNTVANPARGMVCEPFASAIWTHIMNSTSFVIVDVEAG